MGQVERCEGVLLAEGAVVVGEDFLDLVAVVVAPLRTPVALERGVHHRPTGRAAQAEVDAPGEERLELEESLGDGVRAVVVEQHRAGADANVVGTFGS